MKTSKSWGKSALKALSRMRPSSPLKLKSRSSTSGDGKSESFWKSSSKHKTTPFISDIDVDDETEVEMLSPGTEDDRMDFPISSGAAQPVLSPPAFNTTNMTEQWEELHGPGVQSQHYEDDFEEVVEISMMASRPGSAAIGLSSSVNGMSAIRGLHGGDSLRQQASRPGTGNSSGGSWAQVSSRPGSAARQPAEVTKPRGGHGEASTKSRPSRPGSQSLTLGKKGGIAMLGQADLKKAFQISQSALQLQKQGQYQEAAALQLQVLEIRETVLGPEHLEVASTLNNLGGVLDQQGKHEEALEVFQRSLGIKERELGRGDLSIATTLNNLGGVHRALKNYEDSLKCHKKCIAIQEQVQGKGHESVASSLSNLGSLYKVMGELGEAELHFKRCIMIRENVHGATHTSLMVPLNNLAEVMRAQGNISDACRLRSQCLKIEKETLGDDHPNVGASCQILGGFMRELGQVEESTKMFEEAVRVRSKHAESGDDTATKAYLRSLNSLADSYKRGGHSTGPNKQGEVLQKIVEVSQHGGGEDAPGDEEEAGDQVDEEGPARAQQHENKGKEKMTAASQDRGKPDLFKTYMDLGELNQGQRKFDEAETYFKKAAAQPNANPLQVSLRMGKLQSARGDYQEAEATLHTLLKTYLKKVGHDHADTNLVRMWIVDLDMKRQEMDRAMSMMREVLASQIRMHGEEHPSIATVYSNMAECYRMQYEHEEAVPLCRRSLEILLKSAGMENQHTANALNNLAETLRVLGRTDEAKAFHQQALAVRVKVLGTRHTDCAQSLNNLAELFRGQGQYHEAEPLYRQRAGDGPASGTSGSALKRLRMGALLYTVDAACMELFCTPWMQLRMGALLYTVDAALRMELFNSANVDIHQGNHTDAIDKLEKALAIQEAQLPCQPEVVAKLREQMSEAIAAMTNSTSSSHTAPPTTSTSELSNSKAKPKAKQVVPIKTVVAIDLQGEEDDMLVFSPARPHCALVASGDAEQVGAAPQYSPRQDARGLRKERHAAVPLQPEGGEGEPPRTPHNDGQLERWDAFIDGTAEADVDGEDSVLELGGDVLRADVDGEDSVLELAGDVLRADVDGEDSVLELAGDVLRAEVSEQGHLLDIEFGHSAPEGPPDLAAEASALLHGTDLAVEMGSNWDSDDEEVAASQREDRAAGGGKPGCSPDGVKEALAKGESLVEESNWDSDSEKGESTCGSPAAPSEAVRGKKQGGDGRDALEGSGGGKMESPIAESNWDSESDHAGSSAASPANPGHPSSKGKQGHSEGVDAREGGADGPLGGGDTERLSNRDDQPDHAASPALAELEGGAGAAGRAAEETHEERASVPNSGHRGEQSEEANSAQEQSVHVPSPEEEAEMGDQLGDLPAVELQVRVEALKAAGSLADAAAVQKAIVEGKRGLLAPNDPQLAQNVHDLGNLLAGSGQHSEAVEAHRQSLAMREKSTMLPYKDKCTAVAESLAAMAKSLCAEAAAVSARGESTEGARWALQEAESQAERAITLVEQAGGANSLALVESLGLLKEVHVARGQTAAALQVTERALSILEAELGTDHPDTIASLVETAEMLQAEGNTEKALPLVQRAMQSKTQSLGEEHPEALAMIQTAARMLSEMGQYDEALELHQRELGISERTVGKGHQDYANALDNVAVALSNTHRVGEALALAKEALEVRQQLLDEQHSDIATSHNNVGKLLLSQGSYDEAEPMFLKSLGINEAAHGPEGLHLVSDLKNLVAVYMAQDRLDEAGQCAERLVKLLEEAHGMSGADLAQALNKLATVRKGQGRLDDALSAYERCITCTESTASMGPRHSSLPLLLNNTGQLSKKLKRHQQALPYFRRCISIMEMNSSMDDPSLMMPLTNLAKLLEEKLGDFRAALPVRERILNLSQAHAMEDRLESALEALIEVTLQVPDHTKALLQMSRSLRLYPGGDRAQEHVSRIVDICDARNEMEHAQNLLTDILSNTEQKLGEDHAVTSHCRDELTALLQRCGSPAAAEKLGRDALASARRRLRADDPDLAAALSSLARIMAANGKHEEALERSKEALAIQEKVLGGGHPEVAKQLNAIAALLNTLEHAEESAREPELGTWTNNLAVQMKGLGHLEEAEKLYRRALELTEQSVGADHAKVGSLLLSLARLMVTKGEVAASVPLLRRSVMVHEKIFGSDHVEVAKILFMLAKVFVEMRKFMDADGLLLRALAIREQSLGKEHKLVLQTHEKLGEVAWELGHLEAAKQRYSEAVDLSRKLYGADDRRVHRLMQEVAQLEGQRETPDLAPAPALTEDTVGGSTTAEEKELGNMELQESKERAGNRGSGAEGSNSTESQEEGCSIGADDKQTPAQATRSSATFPSLAASRDSARDDSGGDAAENGPVVMGGPGWDDVAALNSSASSLKKQGRANEAELLYARSLELVEAELGPEHPDTADALQSLAGVCKSMGDYESALPLYERCLAIKLKTKGADHPSLATARNNLALLFESKGELKEAEKQLSEAMAIWQRAYGSKHPHVATAQNNMACLMRGQGRLKEAEEINLVALRTLQETLGQDHPHVAAALNSNAWITSDRGDTEEAKATFEAALGMCTRLKLKSSNSLVKRIRGGKLMNEARIARASNATECQKKAASEAVKLLLDVRGRGHSETISAMAELEGR
ncbi:hypothetical protein CYMTET_25761 [Cymbomonas tetramitiformis]|uniref:Kinesin light chain n=1 Tax=Cymbomonas tetramitiformis TaxID=36881 RepID=A0AAE0KYL2_9CHLO|nr:hypothetical protein CYMTET_25761 [Cymbomonas tetramitiformis]